MDGLVWCGGDTALDVAICFVGGPVPDGGSGGGAGCGTISGMVRLFGPKVHKACNNDADPLDDADVFMYHDSFIAPLLDVGRRFKAVLDVLDGVIRAGVSLSGSVDLTVQWTCILRVGPFLPCYTG